MRASRYLRKSFYLLALTTIAACSGGSSDSAGSQFTALVWDSGIWDTREWQ